MSWPFVRTLIHHDWADSTNDLAKRLALENRDDLPLAVWADEQRRGRGRGDHAWWSDAGSLTFSLLLDPAALGLGREHEPRLALASAVAVADVLEHDYRVTPVGVRWPNDVEVAGRKLGGILPERVETERGPRVVIGIGLNVHTRLDAAPAEVRRMAVSLRDLSPAGTALPDTAAVLRRILEWVGRTLPRVARNDPTLAERWGALDALAGQRVRVDLGGRIVEGVGAGIDAEGALLLAAGRERIRLFGGQVLRD